MSNRRRPATDPAARDEQAHGDRGLPMLGDGRASRPRVEADAVSILGAVTAERQAASGGDRERSASRGLPVTNRSLSPALILLLIGATMLLVVGYRLTTRGPAPTKVLVSNAGVAAPAPAAPQILAAAPVSLAPNAAAIETIEPAVSPAHDAHASPPRAEPEPEPSSPPPTTSQAQARTRPADAAEAVVEDKRKASAAPPVAVQAAVTAPARSSKAVVERTAGASTADLIRKCEEFGPLEGLLCRIRICSDLWGIDPACPAQSKPPALTGDAP